jgi:hypothetical protein
MDSMSCCRDGTLPELIFRVVVGIGVGLQSANEATSQKFAFKHQYI